MKLNTLHLGNFTRYTIIHAELPSTVNVIVGSNAAGKTSLLDAITYLLTGACARTDRGGRGAENMVKVGEKEAMVAAAVTHEGMRVEFSRKIPGGLSITEHEGTQTALQDYLCNALGADTDAITAALSTHEFIDMKPSDQKSLLFGLLGLSFERGDVIDRVAAEMPEDRLEQVIRALEAAPAECYTGDGETFARLHKHFYGLRRSFKSRLKDMGTPPAPRLVEAPPPKDEVISQLDALREELSEKRLAKSRATIEASAREKRESELASLKVQLEKAGDPEAARQQLTAVDKEISDTRSQMEGKRVKLGGLADAISALGTEGTVECPLAPGLVACGMTKTKREKVLEDLKKRQGSLAKEAVELESIIDLLTPRREELQEQATLPDRKSLQARIEELETGEGLLEVNTTGLDGEITVLQERITKGESLLAEVNRAEGAREAEEKQASERARLEDQVELLEQLVEVLSPKGLPGRILSEVIGPVEANANERLSELTGGAYSLEMVMEPEFSIFINHEGVRTDLKRLSSSERMRVGVVLQDAIIRLSGLRFLIIDNGDILDKENRALLMDTLMAIKADYDSIILLSTIGPGGVTNPGIEDVSVFLLENGQLKEVAREAAA